MDWAENALFPIFVIALGIIMEKEYPSRRSWLGTCIAFLGFSLFLIPAVKATTPVHHFYVYAVLLPLLGAGGSAVSIMTMSRLSKKGIGRFYAMAVRYALPNLLLLIFSLLYGNSHNLTWLGILAAFIIGAGLMNGALYAALVVLKESGAFLLAVFVMLVPVATTCGERLFGLYTRSSIFYFGAAMILTGVAFIEFSGIFRNSWMKIKQRRDKFIRLTQ